MGTAPYDEIASWYEDEFLGARTPEVVHAIEDPLRSLLGAGTGTCLEIGCGTGAYAGTVRSLGWTAVGVDLSGGMLAHAGDRLPVAQADAGSLPVASGSLPAAVSVMTHTDMPAYERVLVEVARVLRPGGRFVHVGVHPCFCGGFADWTDREAIVIRPGYRDGHWTTASYTTEGLRARVGASHRPLAALLESFLAAGLRLEGFAEGGGPTPIVLGIRATIV